MNEGLVNLMGTRTRFASTNAPEVFHYSKDPQHFIKYLLLKDHLYIGLNGGYRCLTVCLFPGLSLSVRIYSSVYLSRCMSLCVRVYMSAFIVHCIKHTNIYY